MSKRNHNHRSNQINDEFNIRVIKGFGKLPSIVKRNRFYIMWVLILGSLNGTACMLLFSVIKYYVTSSGEMGNLIRELGDAVLILLTMPIAFFVVFWVVGDRVKDVEKFVSVIVLIVVNVSVILSDNFNLVALAVYIDAYGLSALEVSGGYGLYSWIRNDKNGLTVQEKLSVINKAIITFLSIVASFLGILLTIKQLFG